MDNLRADIYLKARVLFEQMLQLGTFPVFHKKVDLDGHNFICLEHGDFIAEFRYQDEHFEAPIQPLVPVQGEKGNIFIRQFYEDLDYETHPALAEFARFRLRIFKKTWKRPWGAMIFCFDTRTLSVDILTEFPTKDYPNVKEEDLKEILGWLNNDIGCNKRKKWISKREHLRERALNHKSSDYTLVLPEEN